MGWHGAPAEQVLAFLLDNLGEGLLEPGAVGVVFGQKDHSYSVVAEWGKGKTSGSGHLTQEQIGQLHVDACTVAGVDLTAAGASVVEIDQDLHGVAHNGVRRLPLDVDDKPDAAGVFFKGWVVESLAFREVAGKKGRLGEARVCLIVQRTHSFR